MAPGSLYLLSEALGRTGANALPYGDDFKFAVRQQVQEVLTEIPSLKVKVDDYTHHTGRTQSLLLLEGTIPMYYQTVKYNIPVAVWLPEQFPLAPPIVYVVPTPDMMIKPGHSVVDPSGSVASLYLENWLYPGSNLRILAEDMSICFGSDPPLFTKPPGWTPDGAHKPGATSRLQSLSMGTSPRPASSATPPPPAQDLATEDALYVLDGLLNRGGIAPEAYLKQVRSLCRQQFMLRALGNKIAAAQEGARGARVSPPRAPPNASGSARDLAAAASGYLSDAVAMPLGDGWANTGILSNPLVGSQAQQRGR